MTCVFLEPSQTRLVTIAAHVDHGKTTPAHSLIEHNGITSERLSSTLRYLDSNPEDQRWGMACLTNTQLRGSKTKDDLGPRIIHLVDSPGHADFSWEVSSALTACDSCLLEALINQLVPVLVINKMDRLCTGLCLITTEAYLRNRLLLESVNAAASAMITSFHQQRGEKHSSSNNDAKEKKKN